MAGTGDGADGEDAILSVPEAAAEAGVSRETVYAWIRRGRLPAVETDGAWRVRRDELRHLGSVRRAAKANRLRVATLRHWADEKE